MIGAGQSGIGPFLDIDQLDTETATPYFIDDGNGGIAALLGTVKLVGQYTIGSITIGTTGLKLISGQQKPGYVAAPSYTLGTAFQNPWWRDATIHLSGGSVTNVKIGVSEGGSVTPVMQATGLTAGTFRLPSGGWFEIDGSVKPTMVAILD